ncbi:hypothetical protein J6590_070372 [Homalodisca vitripennis]|nr:hypothetical protein J6590_070372 [Homalodisca vitripennis]
MTRFSGTVLKIKECTVAGEACSLGPDKSPSSRRPRPELDGPTPCDNYGYIDPLLHSLHKALYRKCSRCPSPIDHKLCNKISRSLPLS